MKKIIEGRTYDTDTAKEIYAWDNGLTTDKAGAFYQTLFKKRNGEYFIFSLTTVGMENGFTIKQRHILPTFPGLAKLWLATREQTGTFGREYAEKALDAEFPGWREDARLKPFTMAMEGGAL